MNSFLNPHNNGPPLTGVIDVTAHSISLFQENEPPKKIIDIFIPKSDISTALPYDVVIDELGDNVITMYQFIGDINDTKVAGLELNYMSENFTEDDPAINEHHYHITKKQYNEETNNIYNIDKSKTFNIKNNIFLTEQYFNTKQNINNNIINNNTTKKNTINNTENILNVKTDYSYKTCVSNSYNHRLLVENNIYKRSDNRTSNNTNNTNKHINQYSTDAFNNYNVNETQCKENIS